MHFWNHWIDFNDKRPKSIMFWILKCTSVTKMRKVQIGTLAAIGAGKSRRAQVAVAEFSLADRPKRLVCTAHWGWEISARASDGGRILVWGSPKAIGNWREPIAVHRA